MCMLCLTGSPAILLEPHFIFLLTPMVASGHPVCESDLSFCCIDTSTGMQCNLSHTYLLDPRDEDLFSATWICTMPTEPRAAAAKDSHGRLEGRNVRVYRAQVKG